MLKPTNYYSLGSDEQKSVISKFYNEFRKVPDSKIAEVARKHNLVTEDIYNDPTLLRDIVFEIAFDLPEIEREFFPE